jgi:hypothetical protein
MVEQVAVAQQMDQVAVVQADILVMVALAPTPLTQQ